MCIYIYIYIHHIYIYTQYIHTTYHNPKESWYITHTNINYINVGKTMLSTSINHPPVILHFSKVMAPAPSWAPTWMTLRIHSLALRFFFLVKKNKNGGNYPEKWPWLLVLTGDFHGIIHSINGGLLVLITGKGSELQKNMAH